MSFTNLEININDAHLINIIEYKMMYDDDGSSFELSHPINKINHYLLLKFIASIQNNKEFTMNISKCLSIKYLSGNIIFILKIKDYTIEFYLLASQCLAEFISLSNNLPPEPTSAHSGRGGAIKEVQMQESERGRSCERSSERSSERSCDPNRGTKFCSAAKVNATPNIDKDQTKYIDYSSYFPNMHHIANIETHNYNLFVTCQYKAAQLNCPSRYCIKQSRGLFIFSQNLMTISQKNIMTFLFGLQLRSDSNNKYSLQLLKDKYSSIKVVSVCGYINHIVKLKADCGRYFMKYSVPREKCFQMFVDIQRSICELDNIKDHIMLNKH